MYLSYSAPMSLRVCGMKYFTPEEYHVTRVYKYSVLILMLGGVLRFFEDGKLIEMHEGEYYIQRAGLLQEGLNIHKLPNSGEPAVYYFIEFAGGEFSDEHPGLPIRGSFKPADFMQLIRACDTAASEQHSVNPFLLNSHMYRIFSELYTDVPNERQLSSMLGMVRRYIDSSYSSICEVDEIAQKFGYNCDYLSKIFHQKYHMTLFRYLKKVRMEHAIWLLQNTDVPLLQIAESVGYDSYSAFYRAFVAMYRISPGEVIRKTENESNHTKI